MQQFHSAKSSILVRVWNDVGSRRPLRKSSINLFLVADGIFEVGMEVVIVAVFDLFTSMKLVTSSFPRSEKKRVAKSNAPATSNLLNDSSVMVV